MSGPVRDRLASNTPARRIAPSPAQQVGHLHHPSRARADTGAAAGADVGVPVPAAR